MTRYHHRHPFRHSCPAISLQSMLCGLAPVKAQSCDIPGVVIYKTDQVSVPASQAKGSDIALPHLVGCSAFEESGFADILAGLFLLFFNQLGFLKGLMDG